jgi:GNAT superfamily N-acetyltransferase
MEVRHARRGDGPGIASVHRENAAYYVDLAPALFRLPDKSGLDEFLEPGPDDNTSTSLYIVAVDNGEIIGSLYAVLLTPDETARFQSPSDMTEVRLFIHAVGVRQNRWRRGVATALVEAAEAWGRERNATVSLCDTWRESPVSLPFWEQRMGYQIRSVRLRKPL